MGVDLQVHDHEIKNRARMRLCLLSETKLATATVQFYVLVADLTLM